MEVRVQTWRQTVEHYGKKEHKGGSRVGKEWFAVLRTYYVLETLSKLFNLSSNSTEKEVLRRVTYRKQAPMVEIPCPDNMTVTRQGAKN